MHGILAPVNASTAREQHFHTFVLIPFPYLLVLYSLSAEALACTMALL